MGVIKKGSNWCSLTDSAVRLIIKRMEREIKYYRRALCSDEFYKQTILYNSHFRDSISPLGNLRLVDWSRRSNGTIPYIFRVEDYPTLSGEKIALFARKFDQNVDMEIVDMIYSNINKDEK